jgi:hypothetical protein
MDSDRRKNIWQKSGRWLRIGTLSLSTLAPLISLLVKRLRAQIEAEDALHRAIEENNQAQIAREVALDAARVDLLERLHLIGMNLSDVLSELGIYSNRAELMKRGEEFTEDLKERGNQFSQFMLARGSELGQNLALRGSQLSDDLVRRGRQARQELVTQQRSFWGAFGFGIGLTAAGIVAFVQVRRRIQSQAEAEAALAESPIQLNSHDHKTTISTVSMGRGEIHAIRTTASEILTPLDTNDASIDISEVGMETRITSFPPDAAFVGVISTKRYYPVGVAVEELTESGSKQVDVVFFATEQEAQLQGFVAAIP